MIINSFIIPSSDPGHPMLADIRYQPGKGKQPVIIFCHGFKGFKDWGHFNLMADAFAQAGFIFLKFNFSLNGTTLDQPMDFADLEAFSQNTFSRELDDLGQVINFVMKDREYIPETVDTTSIYLLGHSRGGGIALLKSAEDARVKKLVTWAAVPDFEKRWNQELLGQWKRNGVIEVYNSRTGQHMPMEYTLVQDYYDNEQRLSIPWAVQKLTIPFLALHGDADESVNVAALEDLAANNPSVQTMKIDGAGHTLGGKHPYEPHVLPGFTQTAIEASVTFYGS